VLRLRPLVVGAAVIEQAGGFGGQGTLDEVPDSNVSLSPCSPTSQMEKLRAPEV
jgi:hypothetical protein